MKRKGFLIKIIWESFPFGKACGILAEVMRLKMDQSSLQKLETTIFLHSVDSKSGRVSATNLELINWSM